MQGVRRKAQTGLQGRVARDALGLSCEPQGHRWDLYLGVA